MLELEGARVKVGFRLGVWVGISGRQASTTQNRAAGFWAVAARHGPDTGFKLRRGSLCQFGGLVTSSVWVVGRRFPSGLGLAGCVWAEAWWVVGLLRRRARLRRFLGWISGPN